MLNIVLFEPEIPPNTGNIMRLCANTGFRLHLIHPLGFALDEKRLRRAGLDYSEWATTRQHANWESFLTDCQPHRLFAFTTKGNKRHTDIRYLPEDFLVFGPESRGLPESIRYASTMTATLRLPMQKGSRSLNLSNSVAIAAFEVWRQWDFAGASTE